MSNNKQDFQKRFMIAVGLSVAILLGWTYFFPPAKPTPNANSNSNANTEQAAGPTPAPALTQPANATYQVPENSAPAESKLITIDADLYTVKFDTRGAVPVSWVLKKTNSSEGEKPLSSIAGTKKDPVPLELISKKGLESTPREVPLRMLTGDQAIDLAVNENAYQVSGADSDNITLTGGDSKTLTFTMTDAATGLEAVKTITFRGHSFVSDLQLKLSKGGQFVPNTRVVVGPSISDQGVKKHHFYRFESEAVAVIGGDIDRHLPSKIADNTAPGPGRLLVNGLTDWAAIGDAYFGMAVVPAQQAPNVEYTGTKYEVEIPAGTREGQTLFQWVLGSNDTKETRHLTSALLPIVADGSTNKVFVGPKDHFGFTTSGSFHGINDEINDGLGRAVDMENMINYGWYSTVRYILRPLSVPILNSIAFLNNLTGSYGTAIIIFTVVLYSLFFPLKLSSARSMKKAQKHQPRMKEIQEQMKKLKADDPKMRELQMEQLRLMKDSNFIGGCLPMLLQIPFFIALYTAITISLDFRQATFLWLPDLSAFDPYHLLEFAMAGSMALTMIFAPAAPAMTQEQQMQQKMMGYIMPVMMLYVLWGAPAGLLLYWFMGNLVTISQQFIINRMVKKNEPEGPEKNTPATGGGAKKMKAKLSTT